MIKSTVCFLALITVFISCRGQSSEPELIYDEGQLLQHLQIISHDSLEGRGFGTRGNIKTRDYLVKAFNTLGLEPLVNEDGLQHFMGKGKGKSVEEKGANVIFRIPGKLDKAIVITAHFDHLGIKNGQIYNGADDDASGTAALLAIADYFRDRSPRHTLIFAAVDGEESGMLGSRYLVNNFPIGLTQIALNINMDMIAHSDSVLYASGLYHYPALRKPLDNIQSNITLLYGHDRPHIKGEEDWTYSSDHGEFHKKKIPFIYFGVEDHKDYHKSTDTFNSINPDFYKEAVRLIIEAIYNYDLTMDAG